MSSVQVIPSDGGVSTVLVVLIEQSVAPVILSKGNSDGQMVNGTPPPPQLSGKPYALSQMRFQVKYYCSHQNVKVPTAM